MNALDELHDNFISLLKTQRGCGLSSSNKRFKIIKPRVDGTLFFVDGDLVSMFNGSYCYSTDDSLIDRFTYTTNPLAREIVEEKPKNRRAIFVEKNKFNWTVGTGCSSYNIKRGTTYIMPDIEIDNSIFIEVILTVVEHE